MHTRRHAHLHETIDRADNWMIKQLIDDQMDGNGGMVLLTKSGTNFSRIKHSQN